jgi:hypothetical protein
LPVGPRDPGFVRYFSQFDSYSVNFHEFGHALRHTVDGSQTHFTNDASRWTYARKHGICGSDPGYIETEAFAFNEGWATYWERFLTADIRAICPSNNPANMTTEGSVAADLADISHILDGCILPAGLSPEDAERFRRKSMFAVINRGENIMHSQGEFRSNFHQQFPGCIVPFSGQIEVSHLAVQGIQYRYAPNPRTVVILGDKIRKLTDYGKELQQEIIRARNDLRPIKTKPNANCDSCIIKITRPAILEARYKFIQYLTQVFKKRYAFLNRKEIYSDIFKRIESNTRRNEDEFVKVVGQINRKALEECISGLKKYFPNDKLIKENIASFERRLKLMSLNTPKNDDVYLQMELPEWIDSDKVSIMEKGKDGKY